MERPVIRCDRCGEDVEAVRGPKGLEGFYDVSNDSRYHKYARQFEQVICNQCMHSDSRFLWQEYA